MVYYSHDVILTFCYMGKFLTSSNLLVLITLFEFECNTIHGCLPDKVCLPFLLPHSLPPSLCMGCVLRMFIELVPQLLGGVLFVFCFHFQLIFLIILVKCHLVFNCEGNDKKKLFLVCTISFTKV